MYGQLLRRIDRFFTAEIVPSDLWHNESKLHKPFAVVFIFPLKSLNGGKFIQCRTESVAAIDINTQIQHCVEGIAVVVTFITSNS